MFSHAFCRSGAKITPKFGAISHAIMNCRPDCGACCIVPSISSCIPGMPQGKPAGVKCIHLTADRKCAIFESPERPEVCGKFKAEELICGKSRHEAIKNLAELENIPYKELLKKS